MYPNLRAEMAYNGVTIKDISNFLGVRYATVSDKMLGKSRFFFDEALKIKNEFFAEYEIEYLFYKEEQSAS